MHLLTSTQLSREELLLLFEQAKTLQESKTIPQTMTGKILGTIFLEPSTRTRLSFETAMLRLGGQIISIPNAESSSLNKGETLEDTGRMISSFADIIAIRTPEKGQVAKFSTHSSVPVINAGDGTGEHPTQHLLDFYTIWKNRGTLDGLTLGLMGDNKNSRVLRGMAKMATVFDIKLIFISPDELQPDEEVLSYLKKKGREYHQVTNIGEVIDQLDVLEINRVRHEYFEDKQRALEIGKQFILNTETVRKGKAELIVLDPLPRINTVQTDVDDLPQAKYFEAVENGVFVRMALMNQLMQR
ncbi:MAG: aspartate carbamoyltransferase [bacterium]|nr:aspartate carbamoyltransferase [bacterium]